MNGCVIHLRGYQLRIDAFYEKHNLALEFHGSQHYIFSKRFHDTQENFIREKELDQVKETLVLDNNIHYIAIPYNYYTTPVVSARSTSVPVASIRIAYHKGLGFPEFTRFLFYNFS